MSCVPGMARTALWVMYLSNTQSRSSRAIDHWDLSRESGWPTLED